MWRFESHLQRKRLLEQKVVSNYYVEPNLECDEMIEIVINGNAFLFSSSVIHSVLSPFGIDAIKTNESGIDESGSDYDADGSCEQVSHSVFFVLRKKKPLFILVFLFVTDN